ncbi:hypothetical protein AB0L88_06120 [Saccharopolyspora shandongensis]|uniref:restriction endonuclease-related protein n=1 Tax=Saccharopolyspora shandongensis TaxID=418495 RepID=UPI0034323ADC
MAEFRDLFTVLLQLIPPVPCTTVRRVPTAPISQLDDAEVRHMVMSAAALAAHALTDTEQRPEQRWRALLDAHGRVLAARGTGSPLTFGEFRRLLSGDLSELLPARVPAAEMEHVRLVTDDGDFEEDVFDLEQEQRAVLRALSATTRAGATPNSESLQAELDQDRVFTALKKRQNQAAYVHGRATLIENPAGTETALRRMNLPSAVTEFYKPISAAATYDRWWFACPLCRWPMRITIRSGRRSPLGHVRCLHRPHVRFGAAYTFRIPDAGRPPTLVPEPPPTRPSGPESVLFPDVTGAVPEPQPTDHHVALTRGVWRWTTIPGLIEVALHRALISRGLHAELWPDLDTYDLHVDLEVSDGGTRAYRIDVKDFTSSVLLAKKIRSDEGDAGDANWLVVPDYRASTVPMLSAVGIEFGLQVAAAGALGSQICEEAGVTWA